MQHACALDAALLNRLLLPRCPFHLPPDFSPAFNAEAPTVFDRIFDPYGRRASFQPSGTAYPVEGERRIVSTTSR